MRRRARLLVGVALATRLAVLETSRVTFATGRAGPAWRRFALATRVALLVVAPVSAWAASPPPAASAPLERWRPLPLVGGRGAQPSALARSVSGDLAMADESGVSWWRDGATERAALPPVLDLDFDARGALWIATLEGLHRWARGERPMPRRMRDGEASNRVRRIASAGDALLLATGAGAYWSTDGRIFQALRVGGAATAVSLVAISRSHALDERTANGRGNGLTHAWLYGNGRLSVVRGLEAASGLRVLDVASLPMPRPVGDGEPVDLLIDPAGERLLLVFEDEIAWRPIEADTSVPGATRWRRERLRLPPGAMIRRVAWAAGRIWITTDHGVVEGETLAGPFRRATPPVGTTDCIEVRAGPPAGAVALCRGGVFALASLGGPDAAPPADAAAAPAADSIAAPSATANAPFAPAPALPARRRLPPDPPLEEIRRRALIRAGLTAGRSHALREGLRRRALWPEVGLRFDADIDSGWSHDRDQSFVSGDTRRLIDRGRDGGRNFGAVLELDWDLGGVVYPDDSVDLSRELRQVVSLRDDVADEINQLYFERQAIRERLAAPGPTPPAEASQLYWRAHELDAGLDAWTGGWISEWRARASARLEPNPDHPAPMRRGRIEDE